MGRGQVRPVEAKVEGILSFPAPASQRQLRHFLGMAGYYRSFCKNFSAVATRSQTSLAQKGVFIGQMTVSVLLIVLRSNAPVLAAPVFDRPFKLVVDVSDVGPGAVLLQDDENGFEHPISYFSKKFNSHQRTYSTIEKEALALVLALFYFEVYVGSKLCPVIVYTDHNPLVFIRQMRNKNQ